MFGQRCLLEDSSLYRNAGKSNAICFQTYFLSEYRLILANNNYIMSLVDVFFPSKINEVCWAAWKPLSNKQACLR